MADIKTFSPTPNISQPGVAYDANGNHFGLPFLNPEGSPYATAYSKADTDLIQKYIEQMIFDTTNEQYAALYTFMYSKPSKEVPSDEYSYKEKVFGRNALTVHAWNHSASPATVTLAGTYATANDIGLAKGDIIALPNNKKGVVSVITYSGSANSTTIGIVPQTGVSFAAGDMTTGDTLALESAAWTDGMNTFSHYDRMQTIDRYNNIQFFHRARRWGIVEMAKMYNNATTNYLPMDKENSLEQMKTDMLATWLNGVYGEIPIAGATSGNYLGKTMNGVYPTMVAAGAPSATITTSGIIPTIESLGFQTNRLAKGKTRFLLGTDAMLHEVTKQFKDPIQYTPNDQIANLNLSEYKMGTMRFVPVVVPQMGDNTIFPEFFDRMILCVDMAAMQPVHMKGIPKVLIQETSDVRNGHNTNMYNDWYVLSQLGMEYNAPQAGFIMNIL